MLAAKRDPILNLALFAASLLLMLLSRVRIRTLLILLIPVALAAAGMFFTGYRFSVDSDLPVHAETIGVSSSALWNGITLASRVLAFAGLGYLFGLTTDRVHLVRSFHKQFRVPQAFAYGLLAAWGIFPQMALEYRRARLAFRARGIHVFPISPAVLKPLLVKSVRWSEELAIAMESKGFSRTEPRTEFSPVRTRPQDWLLLVFCCAVLPVIAYLI